MVAGIVLLVAVCVAAALAAFGFWVWMLVDCGLREFRRESDKIAWVLILIFTNLLGATVYFFAVRLRRPAASK